MELKDLPDFSSILLGIIVGYVLVSVMAMVLPTTFTYVDETGATIEATKIMGYQLEQSGRCILVCNSKDHAGQMGI